MQVLVQTRGRIERHVTWIEASTQSAKSYQHMGKAEAGSGRTLVLDNTVLRRGKSEMPWSRMLMEESRRERDERSDATEAERDAAEDCEAMVYLLYCSQKSQIVLTDRLEMAMEGHDARLSTIYFGGGVHINYHSAASFKMVRFAYH